MAVAVVVHPVVHSCSSSDLALSLVDKWGGVGADGNFPAAHKVEAEQAHAGLA